jgi:hypothetical protein
VTCAAEDTEQDELRWEAVLFLRELADGGNVHVLRRMVAAIDVPQFVRVLGRPALPVSRG